MLSSEAARDMLRSAGIRLTPQRMMVVDVLDGNRSHPTVDSIYEMARQRYPTISLATVYHTVAMLARQGLIRELYGGKDGLRCDPDTTAHAHAYCDLCGKVVDIPLAVPIPLPEDGSINFRPTRVEYSLYGLCTECAERDEPAD